MRKAALGFRYISLDEELKVPTPVEIVKSAADRMVESVINHRASKLRCYWRNRDKYNRQKRSVVRSIEGRYEEAKRQALRSGAGWSFDLEAWELKWQSAGWVQVPGSEGHRVPAFALRGPNRYNNTCMVRLDYSKPWGPDNTKIVFRGEELVAGSRWFVDPPQGMVEPPEASDTDRADGR